MKLIIQILVLFVLLGFDLQAQTGRGKITAAEVFFDTDPGVGNGTALTLDGNLDNVLRTAIQAATPTLSAGMHSVNVRLKDSLNNWGPVFTTTLVVENAITSRSINAAIARFYWDNNIGGAQFLVIFNGSFTEAMNSFIQSSPIATFASAGLHKLNVQIQDANGQYSAPFTTTINVENLLTNPRIISAALGRVYWDNNPGSAAQLLILNGNAGNAINEFITATPVSSFANAGLHKLNVQLLDPNAGGNYGPIFSTTVFFEEELTNTASIRVSEGRVWFDNDVPPASGNMLAFNGNFNEALNSVYQTLPVTVGMHLLQVQLRDSANGWGPVFKTTFVVEDPIAYRNINLSAAEMYFDNNSLSPFTLLAFDGNYSDAIETAYQSIVASLNPGLHTLNVRVQDVAGNWSSPFKTSINVETPLGARNIAVVEGEVSIDNSPPTIVLGLNGNFSNALESAEATILSSGLTSGLHTINVRLKGTDNNWGKTFTTAILLSPCSSTPIPSVSHSRPLTFCNGDSTVLTANAGFNSYTWLRGSTVVGNSPSLVVKTSGSYTVVVTDATNCPNSSVAINVTVNIPVVTITSSANFCQGTTDSLIATPGFSSYLWSAGSTTGKQYITAGGTYTVTATDANGCSDTETITLNQLSQPAAPVISASGPLSFCPGGNVTITSNIATNILWSNGLTVASFTTDTTGYYTVTVTGANGCTNSASVTTLKHNNAIATISVNGPTTYCVNQPSAFSANLSSQYTWSNGETTRTIYPLISGNYSVTVVDSFGCSATSAAIAVTANPLPAIPVISASGPLDFCNGNSVVLSSNPLLAHLWSNGATTSSVTITQTEILTDTVINAFGCKAYSAPVSVSVHPVATIVPDGPTTFCQGDSVILTAQPASGVNYLWHNGATTQSIKATATVNASVIVTEIAGGCSDTAFSNIVVNQLPTGTLAISGPTLICNGTTSTFTASGSPNTKFQWFRNGSPITYLSYTLSCNCLQSYNVYGYSYTTGVAGTYTALAIDTLTGCTDFTNSIVLNVQTPATPVITANGGTTLCINENTTLSSTTAISYVWSTGAVTQDIIAATAGYYTVTTTDNLGCTATSAPTLITFYPTAVITSSRSTTLCAGESVDITAHPTGTYLWSNGSTTATISNITSPGIYTVTVTDIYGCSSISSPVNVIVNALPTGSVSANGPTTFCSGENVTISTSGSANTKFQWYLNGSPITYLSYTPSCNCLQSYNVYGYSYTTAAAGTYSAMVIDTLTGCAFPTNSITVTVNPLPTASISQTAFISCFGGSNGALSGLASGTTPPYSYLWSNAATVNSVTGLNTGSYILIVTDGNGCSGADTFQLGQPTAIAPVAYSPANTRGFNISCFNGNDGTASVTAGGTPPYTYLWNTGAITSSITNLSAGTYTVTVTDANSCSGTSSVTLTQPSPVSITLNPSVYIGGNNIRCKNGNDGSITAIRNGGTGLLSTYLWSNGSTAQTATGLVAGSYTVTVTDSTGCSAVAGITLTEPTLLTASLTPSVYNGYNISCHGANDGTINLSVAGGVAGYHYYWNDTSYAQNRNGLESGKYIVTVTDTNSCAFTDSITLTQPTQITATTTGSLLNCHGDTTGTASVAASGGNGPYTYLWSNGQTTALASGLEAGIYPVTVTDSRGCSMVFQAEVEQPDELIGYAFGTYIECGTQIGLLSVTASGGNAPYSFLWSNGSTASFQTNQPVGNYSVTVTDANGCTDNSFAIIVTPVPFFAEIKDAFVQCENSNDGVLTVTPTGGVTPYMYLWSTGATTQSINSLGVGNYTVIVTDANGCTVFGQPKIIPATIINSTFTINSSCVSGQSSITAVGNGGLAPYSYQWNTGATTATIFGVTPGNYIVTATDMNGCIGTDTVTYQGLFITANGPLTFCTGDSVILTVAPGASYLWSNGATTQSITVTTSGTFSASVNGCSAGNTMTTLTSYCTQQVNLTVLLQGFYQGGGLMLPVIDPINSPLVCDSITLQLADSATKLIAASTRGVISTAGEGTFNFTGLLPGHRYYLVVRHRNHLETWSKQSFLFVNPTTTFDFSTP